MANPSLADDLHEPRRIDIDPPRLIQMPLFEPG